MNFSQNFIEAKKRKIVNCELLKYQCDYVHTEIKKFSLHYCILQEHNNANNDVNKLLNLLKEQLTENSISLIEQATRTQSKSHLWYELRYGRITASKAYEVSRCKTTDGSLVAAIMGAETPDTKAMKRGRILETSVLKTVETKLKKKIKSSGLFLSKEYPMIAATPDGIMKNAVVEIKCPTSDTTKENYIKNVEITAKYLAQVQL
ncbi:hypothetical protein ILUMI_15673 [Ignelater luminosus]|uniref:YqaJ viral recombinase domain-containing protein n=1 Tax=Ignelater luminosus TaxID=2038154 RepID=A0A8K0CN55_IGNLU|nr:hypothetical protein ILUMI_15673 [Ignelater luminosus]